MSELQHAILNYTGLFFLVSFAFVFGWGLRGSMERRAMRPMLRGRYTR